MKKYKKLLVVVLIAAVCLGAFAIARPLGIAERGNRGFGGEILFITVFPVILYPAWKCITDSVDDFKLLTKKDDADYGTTDATGQELLPRHLRHGKNVQASTRRPA